MTLSLPVSLSLSLSLNLSQKHHLSHLQALPTTLFSTLSMVHLLSLFRLHNECRSSLTLTFDIFTRGRVSFCVCLSFLLFYYFSVHFTLLLNRSICMCINNCIIMCMAMYLCCHVNLILPDFICM